MKQDAEQAWAAAIADELLEVERRADRLAVPCQLSAEQAHRKWLSHQQERPEEPRGLGAALRQRLYQAELKTWEKRQAELMARYVCLQDGPTGWSSTAMPSSRAARPAGWPSAGRSSVTRSLPMPPASCGPSASTRRPTASGRR